MNFGDEIFWSVVAVWVENMGIAIMRLYHAY
jgi:hypothetical protein